MAGAQRQALAAAETRSIEGPEGQARVLLGFDDVEELRDVFVVSAYLEMTRHGFRQGPGPGR